MIDGRDATKFYNIKMNAAVQGRARNREQPKMELVIYSSEGMNDVDVILR